MKKGGGVGMTTCFPPTAPPGALWALGVLIVSRYVPDGAGTTAAMRVRHKDFYAATTSASILTNSRFFILKPWRHRCYSCTIIINHRCALSNPSKNTHLRQRMRPTEPLPPRACTGPHFWQ